MLVVSQRLLALVASAAIVGACARGAPPPEVLPAPLPPTAALAASPPRSAESAPRATPPLPRPAAGPSPSSPSPSEARGPIASSETTDQRDQSPAPSDREVPRYSRGEWHHWVDADGDCQDTRTEALIAESLVPVSFVDARHCRVKAGKWRCPYTGVVFTDPDQLDVDHMVPLKNAHASGGWAWTAEQRRAFANDLDEPDHLVVVSKRVNRSKSAHSPDEWVPPESAARCWYVAAWARAKARWQLEMASAERAFVEQVLADCAPPGAAPAAPEPSDTTPAQPRPLLCRDGTFSPSCLCGEPRRGCCSHHGGVAGCAP